MRILFTLLFPFIVSFSFSADIKYPVSEIPEELRKDANAVVREDKTIFRILSINHATVYEYFAVTILNENAKHYASYEQDYDKLTKLTTFIGSVYDSDGKLIRKLKSGEIYDQSNYDGFSLFSDSRFKRANLAHTTYPYTVVFESEKEYKYLYHIDGTFFIPDERVSVQKASYQLIYPPELAPRYKSFNIDGQPEKSTINGSESLSWKVENLKPIKFEPVSNYLDVLPRIIAAPTKFEYEGYKGDMSTWEDYGKWQLSLNSGRDNISIETKQKVRELTSGLTTISEKTKVLYEYLQNRTRYVNVTEGIGGLQPIQASDVDKNGYGDCKALSNFMIALLKECNIKAFYCKIYAGQIPRKFIYDFPSHQTNHIITAVPNGADTIWLECTSQTNPFDYQGTFTGDRTAFLVSELGSKLVKTHSYAAEQNVQSRTAEVLVEANGNAQAKVITTYAGIQYENDYLDSRISNNENQRKWLEKNMGIPVFNINSYSMREIKNRIPSIIVNIDLTLNRLATVSGKRLFLVGNLMNRSTFVPEKMSSKKAQPIVQYYGMTDIDTIKYHLPEELYPEFLPESVKYKTRFGEYESNYSIDQGNLIYIRRVRMEKGEFPPESYQELIDFYKNINKADNAKIVFLNKT